MMKALVLAGGKGVRLRPLTYTRPKQLIPLANKPIISFVVHQIADAGITDVGIIISPETGSDIEQVLKAYIPHRMKITYITQDQPLGLAHAVKTAQYFLKDDPFLMFLGDNLLQNGVTKLVEEFIRKQPDALILLKQVASPQHFGVVVLDKEGHVEKLVEKPAIPPSNLALVGVYLFNSRIHHVIDQIQPSFRNELEITDAIQKLHDMGGVVDAHFLEGEWLDTGKKDDILEANKMVLKEYTRHICEGTIDTQSELKEPVEIGKGTKIIRSTISGPVIIGRNVLINDCKIGSFTTIGDKSTLNNVEVGHSVILENCNLQGVNGIVDSLIGQNVTIHRGNQESKARRLFIGDDSQITF